MSEPNEPGLKDGGKDNERVITDPITHSSLTVHDVSAAELEQVTPQSLAPTSQEKRKHDEGEEDKKDAEGRSSMDGILKETEHGEWWADPAGDLRKTRDRMTFVVAGAASLGALGMTILSSFVSRLFGSGGWTGFLFPPFFCVLLGICIGAAGMAFGIHERAGIPPSNDGRSQQDGTHDGPHHRHHQSPGQNQSSAPDQVESSEWLNALLNSLWPIVNPALFTPLADMLEDTMQATLPKLVHGVRVADVGQGAEAMRLLGVRWLDSGAATHEMKEEGDFAHMEVAVGYRAKEVTRGRLKDRSTNVHLLMQFWIAGGVKVPVWVDVTGFLGTARVRFQLTPNPPFLSTMVVTFLGLPKVDMKCTPLTKGFLNVMDVPGLSGWVQKSIDAALQEYVAPRSLTLDLKTLLMGREKMDTDAFGVIIVTVRRAEGFRNGDGPNIVKAHTKDPKKGDAYVTVGWGKWGKPLWSTRIISVGDPVWEETGAILVGPSEFNAQERLRLQLWDADRITADDLLGNVEVNLQEIMTSQESRNRMSVRVDRLVDEKGKEWPGTIHWECGFYAKTTFEQHLANKTQNAGEVRAQIATEAEKKLREAKARDDNEKVEADQVERQKKEDMRERTEEIIAGSSPTTEWPSGILSVQIEQITGLEIQKIRQSGVKEDAEGEVEEDDLPSAYCTIVINHQRVYKTRTKMKSDNPFYSAGTEKFIRDWTNTDVMIAVRDSRIHEADPVIGVVIIPLPQVFKHRSHFTESLPLVGGIGYGRMRLSLTFRSVQLELPKCLRGWDVGTLEISSNVAPSSDLPSEYNNCRLVFRVPYGKGKMIPDSQEKNGSQGQIWVPKHHKPIRLPVKKRYATCLLILFRRRAVGSDLTPAFCTLWLKDIPDDEEVILSLPVYRNEDSVLAQAQANASMNIDERIGTLELKVRFWPGLSGYHHNVADHDKNMADVMEVLDCAEGEQDASKDLLKDEGHTGSDLSSSSSEGSGSDKEHKAHEDGEGQDEKDGPSGVMGKIKNSRKRNGELHRRHRGLMQWKAVRNVAWVARSMENHIEELGGKTKGLIKHHDREIGIEKEA